jgi:hypothetical protein
MHCHSRAASRIATFTICVIACGCGGGSSATPAVVADTIAEPIPAPAPTLSRFDVPLDFDFTNVMEVVERSVPMRFGDMNRKHQLGDNERKHFAFEAERGPFVAFARGKRVYLRTVLSYMARGYYDPPIAPPMSAGCGDGDGEQRPHIVVELVAPITLTSDWHLKTSAELSQLSPASDSTHDHCRVSFLNIDVTDRVVEAATKAIEERLPAINAKVARVDMTRKATGWWASLNKPIRLTDGVWLLLQPKQLRLGDVSGEGKVLNIEAGLDGYPMIVTGPRPKDPIPPLPPLAEGASTEGFHVLVDIDVDFTTITRTFTKELKGRSFTKGGRTATLYSVSASSRGRKLLLDVRFDGDASGALRLSGTPHFDAARGQIAVPDLDYDLTTDSDLINAYSWLKSDELRALFREKARLPIDPISDQGKELVLKGLNRTIKDQIRLTGTVDSVSVLALYVRPRGLLVRASADGDARVAVRPRARATTRSEPSRFSQQQ